MRFATLLLATSAAGVLGAQVCQDWPLPAQPPQPLRTLIDREPALIDPNRAGRAVGIVFPPAAGVRFERAAESGSASKGPPDHPAIGALLASRPLRVEAGALAKARRATALAAATRISRNLDEFLQEPGQFSITARRWAVIDPDRRIARIASDLERLVPNLGWHSERSAAGEAFIEISAKAEISPARLEPMVAAILLIDRTLVPQSLAIRVPDSDNLYTWYLAAPSLAHEIPMLLRVFFQGHSRFDAYAVCRTKD